MNDDKKLEVIWVQPMREPQLIEIDNDLESMQELVDGYIEEYMPFEDDAAIVCNEEGKMMGLAPNRAIYDQDGHIQEVICGSFFICHAPADSEEVKKGLLKPYVGAYTQLDFSLPCPSIFDTSEEIKEK